MAARPPGTGCHSRGRGPSRVAAAAAFALPLALASGCAGYSPDGIPSGSSSAEVIARRIGPPVEFGPAAGQAGVRPPCSDAAARLSPLRPDGAPLGRSPAAAAGMLRR